MGTKLTIVVILSAYKFIALGLAGDPVFRCDYTYHKSIDGFIKWHDIPADWYDARLRCRLEGARLMSPLDLGTNKALKAVLKEKKYVQNLDGHTYLGIKAIFSKGDFYSVEGVDHEKLEFKWEPTQPDNVGNDEDCLIMSRQGNVGDEHCTEVHHYMCYKANVGINVTECGINDPEYKLLEPIGKCYKLHRVPRVFSDAYRACASEGGHLAILNSKQEAQLLAALLNNVHTEDMVGNFDKERAFIGVHDWGQHGEWLTVHGQTLNQAGFKDWAISEPHNNTALGGSSCGSITKQGLLAATECAVVRPFICEKTKQSLQTENCDPDHHSD